MLLFCLYLGRRLERPLSSAPYLTMSREGLFSKIVKPISEAQKYRMFYTAPRLKHARRDFEARYTAKNFKKSEKGSRACAFEFRSTKGRTEMATTQNRTEDVLQDRTHDLLWYTGFVDRQVRTHDLLRDGTHDLLRERNPRFVNTIG